MKGDTKDQQTLTKEGRKLRDLDSVTVSDHGQFQLRPGNSFPLPMDDEE